MFKDCWKSWKGKR